MGVLLNGTNQQFNGTFAAALNEVVWTFVCWFWTNSLSPGDAEQILFRVEDSGGGFGWKVTLVDPDAFADSMQIQTNYATGTSNKQARSAGVPVASWAHAAFIHDSGAPSATDSKIFLNGVSKTMTNASEGSGGGAYDGNKYFIGGRGSGASSWFNGRIAHPAIYPFGLSQSEITALQAFPPWRVRPTGLKHYWRFRNAADRFDLIAGSDPTPINSPTDTNDPPIASARRKLWLPAAFTAPDPPDPPPADEMLAAHRTTGVAPLSVHFLARDTDLTTLHKNARYEGGTTSGIVQPGDGDVYKFNYSWKFGDPSSGNWTTGRHDYKTGAKLLKNEARGHTVAHVFESPGTYTVTLVLIDDAGERHDYTQDVVVSADTKTQHFFHSTDGDDADDGLTPGTAKKTLTEFQTVLDALGADHKYLFALGKSFDLPASVPITIPSSGTHVGVYDPGGGGADPVFTRDNDFGGIDVESSDVRIVGIDLKTTSTVDATNWGILPSSTGDEACKDLLLWGVTITGWRDQLKVNGSGSVGHEKANYLCVYEGTHQRATHNNCYVGGRYISFLGCKFDNDGLADNEHNWRVPWATDAVLSFCDLVDPNASKICIKLFNAAADTFPDASSHHTIMSDNFLRPTNTFGVVLGPSNFTSEEFVEDNCFERNVMAASTRFEGFHWNEGINLAGDRNVVRNNVFEGSEWAGTSAIAIKVAQRGIGPVPDLCRVYNNTVWHANASSSLGGKLVVDEGTNTVMQNNVIVGPVLTHLTVADATHASNLVQTTAQADFVAPTASPQIDVRINTGSTLKDHADGVETTYMRRDTIYVDRPQNSETDIGAFEFDEGEELWPPPVEEGESASPAELGGVRSALAMVGLGT